MILPIILSLVASFLFSGIESAFLSANKLHIELQRKSGQWTARILSVFVKNPSKFLSTILIGNTLSLVIYGYYMALFLDEPLHALLPQHMEQEAIILVIQSLVSALIVLFVAEFTPKNLFMLNPNWFLSVLALPVLSIYYLLSPVVQGVVWFSKFFLSKLLGAPYKEEQIAFRYTDLNDYIQHLASDDKGKKIGKIDTRIFTNALEFKRVKVRDCMVPRPELVAVDEKEGRAGLRKAFLAHGHSRILVYRKSIDNITGYCHMFSLVSSIKHQTQTMPEQNPLLISTETMLANDLLIQMLNENKSMALIVDEYGGTAGIVTIEDIIEEIFGEIHDEYDQDTRLAQQLDTNKYLFSARIEIDYLNEHYNFSLPTGDYDTLGGLILSINEKIPDTEEKINVGRYTLRIASKEEHRIDKVELYVRSEEELQNESA